MKFLIFSCLLSAPALAMNVVEHTKTMIELKRFAPKSHQVAIDINYALADKCDSVLSVEQLMGESLYTYLSAIRSLAKDNSLPKEYWSALKKIECDNVSSGVPES